MMKVQVTLRSDEGRRPLSTVIEVKSKADWEQNKDRYKQKAVIAICAKRHMTLRDLNKYGYKIIQCGDYEKIQAAKATPL